MKERLAVVLGAACAALLLGASAASADRAPGQVVREPQSAPAAAFVAAPLEWQVAATRLDQVPADALRAARRITIAVIDTGADVSAPDVAAKGPARWNVRSGSRDVTDSHGHGTFVASLAAGSVTKGEGIAGFGGDARLLVVKAGGADGRMTDIEEADAIVYAVKKGAKVINLSLGGPTTSAVERKAVAYAQRRGVLLVAAVGNGYSDGNAVEYPAALLGDRGLAVAASTQAGTRASFSSTGPHVSIAAPGENVFAAVSTRAPERSFPRVPLAGSLAGVYGVGSGTSFAAPQVAGAAALVWGVNAKLTARDVARILKQTASGRGVRSDELGYGVLDVAAAVEAAQASTRSI